MGVSKAVVDKLFRDCRYTRKSAARSAAKPSAIDVVYYKTGTLGWRSVVHVEFLNGEVSHAFYHVLWRFLHDPNFNEEDFFRVD